MVDAAATETRKATAICSAVAGRAASGEKNDTDKRETRKENESVKHTTRLLIAEVVLLLLSLAVAAAASS